MSNSRRKAKATDAVVPNSEPLASRKRLNNGKAANAAQKPVPAKRAKRQQKTAPEVEQIVQDTLPEAVVTHGIVLTVGTGSTGQLGLGEDVESKTRPSAISFSKPVKSVCAGGMHTVILTEDGQVYTFGCNDEGAIGRDSSESGSEYLPDIVEIPAKITQVSAGDSHTAALTEEGSVYVWGNFRDADGAVGLLTKDRKEMRPVLLPMSEKIKQIASGSDHLVLLTQSGHIYTCGNAAQGQLGRVAECFSTKGGRKGLELLLKPAIIRMPKKILFDSIWAGSCATIARAKSKPDIYCCGLNNHNQLGLDGDYNLFNLKKIPSLSNKSWRQFSCGDHHTLGLTNEGEVYAIGRKEYGRLGLGSDAQDAKTPVLLSAFKNDPCTSISCCVSSSFAVSKSGTAFAWGLGNSGQLGQGNEDDVWEPTPINGKQLVNRKVINISGGGQHAVLLVTDTGETNEHN